jgi:toxin ParE1/3/4
MPTRWRPVLSAPAEQDLRSITRWTASNFGPTQANLYNDLILSSLMKLRQGPDVPGARLRRELGPLMYTLYIGRRGKPGRHFLLYRPTDGQVIEVVRILHQAMDIERQIRPAATGPGDA